MSEFVQIPNFPNYFVNDIGAVRSTKGLSGRILKTRLRRGYPSVGLRVDGERIMKTVHKLMQSAFGLGDGYIDHQNGIRTDNRLENLRVVTNRQNLQNKERHRNGKLVGASYHKRLSHLKKPWRSTIYLGGKTIQLGYHESELAAHTAYMQKLSEPVDESESV